MLPNAEHGNYDDRRRTVLLEEHLQIVHVQAKVVLVRLAHDGLEAKLNGWSHRRRPAYGGDDDLQVPQLA